VRIVLPGALADRAAEVAAGERPAVELQPASTVVLLRPGPSGAPEAYLQRRHRSLAFAGGMFAFPGGRIDAADTVVPDHTWGGPSPQRWAEWFGCPDPAQARAHVVGVVRELFEETGVLLSLPGDTGASRTATEADRAAVTDGRPLGDLLAEIGHRLDSAALRPWARWLTPRFESRRFDAWFFVAALPAAQQPRVATDEAHEGRWVAPDQAERAMREGELAMLPPTWWTLRQLAAHPDVESVLAGPAPLLRYTVGWAREGDDAVMVLPDDPRYPGDDPLEGS
jgi:8-oxo-dGTP pyrophosphatase MutT (NUDIX family)